MIWIFDTLEWNIYLYLFASIFIDLLSLNRGNFIYFFPILLNHNFWFINSYSYVKNGIIYPKWY